MPNTWLASKDYVVGDVLEPPSILAFVYECTVAGKSGLSEPAWPSSAGATVVDGAATWTARTATTITWTASPLYQTGATQPTWNTTIGGTTTDGTITWTTRSAAIDDAKCPQSKVAIVMASKVFSPYRDVIRYCATNYPRDWSTQDDAGFLPTGQHAPTSPEATALGEYRGRLAVFTPSNLQIWTVDPDPAEMSLFDSIPGIGTVYPDALASVSGDLFFLTRLGVRSMSIAAGAENLQTGDVGTPIDALIQAKLAGPDTPIGMYYPGNGQFWLAFGTEVFVYSQSRLGKVGAWSRYVYPYAITGWTQLNGELYLRSGTHLYRVDEFATSDDGVEFEGVVWFPYLDMGNPGTTKMLEALDITAYGSSAVSIGYDQSNTTAYTTPYTIDPDTVPGGRVPMAVSAPSMSVKVAFAPGQSWELLALQLYLQDQGMGR